MLQLQSSMLYAMGVVAVELRPAGFTDFDIISLWFCLNMTLVMLSATSKYRVNNEFTYR
jgi:hypothetical protein